MATSERTDQQLIEAYLAGDQASFESLYQRYRRPLYAYLNKMVPGQPQTADDLFQKSWIKAIKNLHRYRDQQTFYAWMARIAHNCAIDHFRREAKSSTTDIEELQVADEGPPPWEGMNRREVNAALSQALEDLAPEQREVFLLRQRDVPFKEIAAIQGCSTNTALGRMHYALNNLRQALRDFGQ